VVVILILVVIGAQASWVQLHGCRCSEMEQGVFHCHCHWLSEVRSLASGDGDCELEDTRVRVLTRVQSRLADGSRAATPVVVSGVSTDEGCTVTPVVLLGLQVPVATPIIASKESPMVMDTRNQGVWRKWVVRCRALLWDATKGADQVHVSLALFFATAWYFVYGIAST